MVLWVALNLDYCYCCLCAMMLLVQLTVIAIRQLRVCELRLIYGREQGIIVVRITSIVHNWSVLLFHFIQLKNPFLLPNLICSMMQFIIKKHML